MELVSVGQHASASLDAGIGISARGNFFANFSFYIVFSHCMGVFYCNVS